MPKKIVDPKESGEIVDLRFLMQLEMKGEKHIINWCMENNLIAKNVLCPKCGLVMKLLARKDRSDGYEWRCRSKKQPVVHNVKRSVRKGSWFCDSRLKIGVILQIMYMWFQKMPHNFIKKELHVADNTIIDWKIFCRKVCQEICHRENVLLGGSGVIVEVGESTFIKKRIFRGPCVDGKLVIGGIERGTNKCFFKVVETQGKQTLLNIIKENIFPGSVVISECWDTYDCLSDETFLQLESTDGFILKSPETSSDVDTIDKEWVAIKESIPPIRETEDFLESHLAEYTWRRRYSGNSRGRFMSFLAKIAKIETRTLSSKD